MMKNKNIWFLIMLIFYSCGVYRYEIQSGKMLLISKKGNNISRVYIQEENGEQNAEFEQIKDKPSKIFSLKDFSPDYFKCTEGCPFQFEQGKIYLIKVFPSGDRVMLPIRLKINSDGSIMTIIK